ncbi:hypothetical protein [Agrococcus sp. ARC_14]|uniref:hypothetical protein n=1 Tax=Agrococcus sp. ARC_14 TaxID=2919927 RepID=UPI001F06ECC8|nr:hypothetical protein [Agrococcus sp. ARC_14]MCH1883853.1 hypothetical protein [Agrococcus sp. ARC_14]
MRKILPIAVIAAFALAGCASAGGPAETSAPATSQSTETTTGSPVPTEPDDDTSTATPAPSPPPTAEVPESPSRITDDAVLGSYDALELPSDEPFVAWADADHTLIHVIGTGSGSEACQPVGDSAEVDDGRIEIEFDWPETDAAVACTADLRVFGWEFWVPTGSADITTATVDGWTQDADDTDDDITVDIQPMR